MLNTTLQLSNTEVIKIIALIVIAILIAYKLITHYHAGAGINYRTEIDQSILYLQSKIKNPPRKYKPNKKLFEKFQNTKNDEKILTSLAMDILNHCKLKPAALTVRIHQLDAPKNIAGEYKIFKNNSVIEIYCQPSMNKKEILAILIHECMHFYLRCRGIQMQDTQQNEILTDVTTIYMGFYEYMKNGYGRAGYITRNSIEYIYRKLN